MLACTLPSASTSGARRSKTSTWFGFGGGVLWGAGEIAEPPAGRPGHTQQKTHAAASSQRAKAAALTFQPCLASSMAASAPEGPAPTMTAFLPAPHELDAAIWRAGWDGVVGNKLS